MRLSRQWMGSGIAFAFLLLALPLPACGPFWWQPEFTRNQAPDWPEAAFAAGHLGVVGADLKPRDRFIAYRVLAGVPFSAAEIQALLAPPTPAPPVDWLQQWTQIQSITAADPRATVWGRSAPGLYRTETSNGFQVYLNCPEDAFRNAVQTYQDRGRRYAGEPELLAEWFAGQQQVFYNCTGAVPQIPAPLPADRPALARADRSYQIAAAHFYARDYALAAKQFLAIARDAKSPWAASGGYLAARAMVRQATVSATSPEQAKAWLARAEQQDSSVVRDPGDHAWWPAARQLSGFIELRLHPARRALELERRVLQPGDPTLRQDVIDLKYVGFDPGSAGEKDDKDNDLLAWVTDLGGAVGYPYTRWRATHTLPWLVLALQNVPGPGRAPLPPGLPRPPADAVPSLLAAAARVPPTSPGFEAVRYQRLRIELQQGMSAQVAAQVAAIDLRGMPVATQNRYHALAFRAAQSLAQAAAAAPRTTVDGGWVGFDEDALTFFNDQAPLALWRQTAALGTLPPRLESEIVHAGWTRAVLLDDSPDAAALGARLARLQPTLADGLSAYQQASSPVERHFQAAFLLLHMPGMSPWLGGRTVFLPDAPSWDELDNNYNDNWWRPQGAAYLQNGTLPFWNGGRDMPWLYGQTFAPPAFFAGPAPVAPSQDFTRLAQVGPAPNLLARWVLHYVQTQPPRLDPKRDEALALALRATVEGCGDQQTPALSKQVYDLLQQDAASPWALQAPQPDAGGRLDKWSVCLF